MCEHRMYVQAREILARHGCSPSHLGFVGAGEQSVCYGTTDVAVLLSKSGAGENVMDPTGHVIPGSDAATSCND